MITKVFYGEEEIEFELKKGLQNKVEISILPNISVEVKAPEYCLLEDVKSKVLKRARWIVKTRNEMEMHRRDVLTRQYISGECHFYLGRRYVLKVIESDINSVKLKQGFIIVKSVDLGNVKKQLEGWYKKRALKYFKKRLKEISESIPWVDQEPPLRLFSMKKQWGSCSPKGLITLNPHLVKSTRECIDYVIIHELCHLKEHNHSPRFYQLLDQIMPGWKQVKAKLDSMAEVYLNT